MTKEEEMKTSPTITEITMQIAVSILLPLYILRVGSDSIFPLTDDPALVRIVQQPVVHEPLNRGIV